MNEPHDSSSDDELVFSTFGSSIDEAYGGVDDEDDVDDVDFDSFDDKDE